MAAAQTGTGKTACFTLPILEILSNNQENKNHHELNALIVTPTRELASQVHDNIKSYGKHLSLKSIAIYGGVSDVNQKQAINNGIDIMVATPGRLLDLYHQKAINFSKIKILVLDEADQMLDMGFINDIKKIDKYLPKKRQNLMFTATFSDPFRSLVKQFSNDPIEISVAKDNETGKNIEHYCHPVDASNKAKLLIHLIKNEKWNQALVFTRTKHGANRLTKKLINAKITAVAIHSNKTQNYRTKALNKFKKNHIQILVATDVAARGIDIKNMNQVVNFDLPSVAKDYIHRIGRTGRAGKSGKAISFVCSDQQKLLSDIQKLLNQKLPMYAVEGFEPTNDMQPIKKSKKKKKFRKRFKK
jgi:ATP-dependent RNA helicase RhlE